MPALMNRPLGFKPSPPGRIDALNFCIQAYHWPARTCISSGDGRDWGSVEWRKMNRNFGMTLLQTVSHTRAEACPPPCVNTTNKLQPFGHRRGEKITRTTLSRVYVGHRQAPLPARIVYAAVAEGLDGSVGIKYNHIVMKPK